MSARHAENGETSRALIDRRNPTDVGNAERLVAAHGDRVRYVPRWAQWMAWDGTRWQRDHDHARVDELAKDVPRRLWKLVPDVHGDERKRLIQHATQSEADHRLRAMVRLARSIPTVCVDYEHLDADPWLLNCLNGTLDLRTGELEDHDPENLITQLAPVRYDANASAPMFTKFLAEIFPDQNLRSYMQRWVGYCLTGDVTEHVLQLCCGKGANGKSTLFAIFRALLGDYTAVFARELAIAQRFEQHPTAIAELFRARLATCVELPENATVDEARVKALTGGDTISARRMRENPWTFAPTHKIMLATNFRPNARADDDAYWRRIHVVPFDVTITADAIDRNLAERIITTELDGILSWALEGLREWQAGGLRPPSAVSSATGEYRKSVDSVDRFLREHGLTFEADLKVMSSDLQRFHTRWCADEGIKAEEHWQSVTPRLRKHGAEPKRKNDLRYWIGVGIPTRSCS
jgi:putative DNA primase/helicase